MLDFENNIVFSSDYISVLEVCNKKLFRSIVNSLLYIDDNLSSERIVLIDDDKEINISRNTTIITDVFSIELNTKKLITAALDKLNNICSNDIVFTSEIEKSASKLREKINILLSELNSDFIISQDWNLNRFLKAFDFGAEAPIKTDCLDNVLRFLQIQAEFFINNIIVFINLKSFFEESELSEIYKMALYNNQKLLLVESGTQNISLKYEKVLVINEEFDEVVLPMV